MDEWKSGLKNLTKSKDIRDAFDLKQIVRDSCNASSSYINLTTFLLSSQENKMVIHSVVI